MGLVTSEALGRAGDQQLLLGQRVRDSQRGSAGTHQLRDRRIQQAERVVQEVEAGSGVEVCIAPSAGWRKASGGNLSGIGCPSRCSTGPAPG